MFLAPLNSLLPPHVSVWFLPLFSKMFSVTGSSILSKTLFLLSTAYFAIPMLPRIKCGHRTGPVLDFPSVVAHDIPHSGLFLSYWKKRSWLSCPSSIIQPLTTVTDRIMILPKYKHLNLWHLWIFYLIWQERLCRCD